MIARLRVIVPQSANRVLEFARSPVCRAVARRSALLSIATVAAFLFFFRIDAKSMWLDEIVHRERGRRPIPDIMNSKFIGQGQFSHLYYLINRWSEDLIGDRDFACRAPQAASALASVFFIYLLGRHLYGTGAGLLASLLFATSPFVVQYAQENRFYHMASLGVLATYYCYVRFLDVRTWRRLAAFVLVLSFALRSSNIGIVVALCLGAVTVALLLLSVVSGRTGCYEISGKTVAMLALAAVAVGLLWMPYTVRAVRHLVLHGPIETGKSEFDASWVGATGVTLPAVAEFVWQTWAFLGQYADANATLVAVLIAMSAVGSLVFGRWKAIVLYLFTYAMTVTLVHIMNQSKAVTIDKRLLFLCPVVLILLAGGVSSTVRFAGLLSRHVLMSWGRGGAPARLRHCISACSSAAALVCVTLALLVPVVGGNLYRLGQWYYVDGRPHKVLAKVLAQRARESDPVWYRHGLDSGLIQSYLPAGTVLGLNSKDPLQLSRSLVERVVDEAGGLWLHNIDPRRFGFSGDQFIQLDVANTRTYLLRPAYFADESVRTRDAVDLYRHTLQSTDFPEVGAAARLIELLLDQGAIEEADDVARRVGACISSREAVAFAADHFFSRGVPAVGLGFWCRHANLYFWVGALQLHVAQLALEQGEDELALRCAKRHYWLLPSQRGARAEIIGRSYLGLGRRRDALRWLTRARNAAPDESPTRTRIEETLRDAGWGSGSRGS